MFRAAKIVKRLEFEAMEESGKRSETESPGFLTLN